MITRTQVAKRQQLSWNRMIGIGDDWIKRYLPRTSVIPQRPAAEIAMMTASNFDLSGDGLPLTRLVTCSILVKSGHTQLNEQQTDGASLTELQLGKPGRTGQRKDAPDTDGTITSCVRNRTQ